jgi:hypothetical protein
MMAIEDARKSASPRSPPIELAAPDSKLWKRLAEAGRSISKVAPKTLSAITAKKNEDLKVFSLLKIDQLRLRLNEVKSQEENFFARSGYQFG